MPDDVGPLVGAAARKAQVADQSRPGLLGAQSEDISEEVRRVREIADTWKVYVKEWIIVSRHESLDAGLAYYDQTYDGRVHPEDVRWRTWDYDEVQVDFVGPVFLQLRLWNQRGEWKHKSEADTQAGIFVREGSVDTWVVGRNSREEVLLKEYSRKKLVTVTGEERATA